MSPRVAAGLLGIATAACFAAGLVEPIGAVGMSAATLVAAGSGSPARRGELAHAPAHVELARARRDDRGADVLVAVSSGPTARERAEALASTLRVTDGVTITRRRRSWELCAVVDSRDGARGAIEERFNRMADSSGVALGWSRFPADGVTLEALTERARPKPVAPRPRHGVQRVPLPLRLGLSERGSTQ